MVVDGRVVAGLVAPESEARGVARVVELSPAAGRVLVRGRFAAAVDEAAVEVRVVPEMEVLEDAGDLVPAAVEDSPVRRTVGFLFSSPEVMEAMSGSDSEAVDLCVRPVRLAVVPGAGRVGGLFRLEPAVPERIVELASGREAVVEALAVPVVDVVGRRAEAAVPAAAVVVGRRGGTGSLEEAAGALEAILRRVVVEGEAGEALETAGGLFSWGASAGRASGSPAASLAAGGTSSAIARDQRRDAGAGCGLQDAGVSGEDARVPGVPNNGWRLVGEAALLHSSLLHAGPHVGAEALIDP